MKHRFCFAALSMLLMSTGSAQASASHDDVFGRWLSANGKAVIEISPCGQKACGKIVWMEAPFLPDGRQKTDINNEDSSFQSRTICGLPLVGDFERQDDGRWGQGFIYDPESGKTYKSQMHVKEDGTLYVRGYIGTPLLGRSQIWTPADSALNGC